MTRARGVDVSSVQAQCDWQKLAAGGFDFVIVKATQGATSVDPYFVRHVCGARSAGILTGAYHFLTATSAIVDQVSNAYQVIEGYDVDLGCFIDLEYPEPKDWKSPIDGQWLAARALQFADRMSNLLGGDDRVKVYSYPDFLRHLFACSELDELERRFGLWIASYHDEKHEPGDADKPTIPPGGWSSWAFWQWSGNNGLAAPGIPQVVDHDVYNGTREDLLAWCRGTKIETAPTDPAPQGPAA